VGVIIGDDMRMENGAVITDHTKRTKSGASLKGIKSLAQRDPSARPASPMRSSATPTESS
jgi:hypothetical protein